MLWKMLKIHEIPAIEYWNILFLVFFYHCLAYNALYFAQKMIALSSISKQIDHFSAYSACRLPVSKQTNSTNLTDKSKFSFSNF